MTSSVPSSASFGAEQPPHMQFQNRYHFNNVGVVKEILYPNKAIIGFKLNGKDEKAILLSKILTMDGKSLDEAKPLQEFIKANDVIEFDCHIYDKGGGIGSGKDKCNYYAMRAWKNSKEYDRMHSNSALSGHQVSTPIQRNNTVVGTGWVSELSPRKGVLTFENMGRDERVLFLASKVWFFEKRLGSRQPLTDVLSEGDPVQFEAVPQESSEKEDNSFTGSCPWFANLVWKGRRPSTEDHSVSNSGVGTYAVASSNERRASLGSSESSNDNLSTTGDDVSLHPTWTNGFVNDGIIKGAGIIGKIINDKTGVIWWLKSANHLQSVWFDARQTFLYGSNLADKNLLEVFNEGDPVIFLAEKPQNNFPTKWVAKQVLVSHWGASIVAKIIGNGTSVSLSNGTTDHTKAPGKS